MNIGIELSEQKVIQKRIVNSFLNVFGELGGINDLILLIVTSFHGFILSALFKMGLSNDLFFHKVPDKWSIGNQKALNKQFKMTKQKKMSCLERTATIFPLCKCLVSHSGRRKLRELDKSMDKVNKVLDIQSLMATHNTLR